MHEDIIRIILQEVAAGTRDPDSALDRLRHLPTETLPSARIDTHRSLRTGIPEAVFGENKTVDQLVEILGAMLARKQVVLATRISPNKASSVQARLPQLDYHAQGRMLTGNKEYIPHARTRGEVVIVTAGTSDLPVAEEARISLEYFGHRTHTVLDAGVAGLHRILAHTQRLASASVIIVVAGMEGALPTVVAGMVRAPVIGVPSSIGYGTGAGGFSALLGMLNSCAPGLAVVNIDNGFGAACMAAAINLCRN
ncbi:nickel pincer cofactor biosynthesis protein LarB [Desulfolithobacter sp.]